MSRSKVIKFCFNFAFLLRISKFFSFFIIFKTSAKGGKGKIKFTTMYLLRFFSLALLGDWLGWCCPARVVVVTALVVHVT